MLPTWSKQLEPVLQSEKLQALKQHLRERANAGVRIYPDAKDIFACLNHCDPDKIKVVILGQDPYHGVGQAHGLCFSVKPKVAIPPSLANIYRELKADCDISPAKHGCLIPWAEQGVLLLNTVLTVEQGQPASHAGMGWEDVTDQIIDSVITCGQPVVFMLWGAAAQRKVQAHQLRDNENALVLTAPHPSPLSAHRGYLGCKHFSSCNAWLQQKGLDPIDWQLPSKSTL